MSNIHGLTAACPSGDYLHRCHSSTVTSPSSQRTSRRDQHPERWVHARICPCGYSTPLTTDATARNAIARHHCVKARPTVLRAPLQLELPYDLPAVATAAVTSYLADRRKGSYLDVDAAAVIRFAAGEHTLHLNPLERVAVYAMLRRRGWSQSKCAGTLRLSWATQARYRRVLEAAS